MDRLDMALDLIREAQQEKKAIENFEKETLRASSYEDWNKVYSRYGRIPKKSIVNENLKMARRIILGEYM